MGATSGERRAPGEQGGMGKKEKEKVAGEEEREKGGERGEKEAGGKVKAFEGARGAAEEAKRAAVEAMKQRCWESGLRMACSENRRLGSDHFARLSRKQRVEIKDLPWEAQESPRRYAERLRPGDRQGHSQMLRSAIKCKSGAGGGKAAGLGARSPSSGRSCFCNFSIQMRWRCSPRPPTWRSRMTLLF